jgi:separase
MMLEEYNTKTAKQQKSSRATLNVVDEHLFLVLDKNVQGLPWESLPILRGRSISRIPGVQFLQDRLSFAKWKRESAGQPHDQRFGAAIDPRKGYYILNPSKDLGKTEERFRDWAKDMKKAGWGGVIGEPISEQQFVNALETQDLVVYVLLAAAH